MKKLVDPVMEAYAKEIGADISSAINNTNSLRKLLDGTHRLLTR